jgi:adenylate cyclase class 1
MDMSTEDTSEIIVQIKGMKDKFNAYNSAKINSLNSSLATPELINLFNYIPFLFTVNQPEFPGYVKEIKSPHGIVNYKINPKLQSQLKISNPSFSPAKNVITDPVIHLFALIGSAGTIAFTPDSDLDFWICGRFSLLDPETVAHLRHKCSIIENWAMNTHGKEIHFFLNDVDQIKMNVFDEDEEYGLSGTSLGQMLKEEFYRSSIIINNVVPFWWVVPADCSDAQYTEWLSAISENSIQYEFIDLGNIAGINKADFLIAALFQIIKSLGNPFKSIIKLGLLERYIHDDKKNPFISNIIKRNVHEGKTDKSSVDAYCLMFDQVYDYYHRLVDDMTSLNIIKTCFYLKVNPHLSTEEKNPGNENFHDIMTQYTKKWGWDSDTIKHVDNFENWDIESTNKMMNNTKKVILKGYKNILAALGNEINSGSIDRESLLAINRKIYSHFNPEDKKIDNTLNFKKYPPEKLLSLDYVRDIKGSESWYLNKRIITNGRAVKVMIRKSPHLISLIVWISLNGLYQKDYTRLDIEQGFYHMDSNYIRDLIAELSTQFSIKSLNLQNSYFLRDPFPVMSYIIINPFLKYSKKADEFYHLYHNSWGETRFEIFHNENDFPAITERIVNGALISTMDANNALHITASEPFSTSKEFLTLKSTMKKLLLFFTDNKTQVKQRFITMIAKRFTIFSNTIKRDGNTSVSFSQFGSEHQMLYTISYNRGLVNRNRVDEKIPELEYISKILSYDSDDSIKIFIHEGRKYSRFFVLNERGSLMMFRKKSEFHNEYLAGLFSFAESAVEEIMKSNPESNLAKNDGKISAYIMEIDIAGKSTITKYDYERDLALSNYREKLFPVCLSLHLLDSGEVGYRFTLPDGGNSELFSRVEIESVSREISSLMESIKEYKFFPTSVNLENSEIKMYSMFTSFAFSEKNRFELLIEKNLGML